MSAREAILAAIAAARPAEARPLPAVPAWTIPLERRVAAFTEALLRMGGRLLAPPASRSPLEAAQAWIAARAAHGPVWSTVPELPATRSPDPAAAPHTLADLEACVARAAFGVAETGSVAFREEDLVVAASATLAQHLLVLLDRSAIVGGLHDCYARPEFARAHYLVLHSGPSATADIEGVLIHGAQGVRSLSILLTDG